MLNKMIIMMMIKTSSLQLYWRRIKFLKWPEKSEYY